ncbi:MAG: dTMP kinase [Deltaproteobacteria bacterium]|nr:dTMP kinase [Deltaproteobacteria bacterium]
MFISFEGIEGSGKTTQIKHVSAFLENEGIQCVMTREPGGTDIGRRIRAILLDPRSVNLDPLAELLLYMADRAQHLNQIVKVNLDAGRTVLCDRYFDATLAYQGHARGLDADMITLLHRQAFENLKPDLTFLLDLTPEEGLARAWRQIDDGGRAAGETRFEEERAVFHEKVREGYLMLADKEPGRFVMIDAAMDEDGVRAQICSVLYDKMLKVDG